jgi:(p)ppGpp synthase/HD superfamily hydrolase
MTFEQAIEIAARAHAGRKDKYGEPELMHVLQMVVAVPPEGAWWRRCTMCSRTRS